MPPANLNSKPTPKMHHDPDMETNPQGSGETDSATIRLLRAVGITGAGTVLAILLGAVTQKVLALVVGPSGVGLVSQLTVFRAFVMAGVAVGLPASMTRFVAESEGRGTRSRTLQLQRSALVLTASVAVFATILGIGFPGYLAKVLFGNRAFLDVTLACAIGGAVGGIALVVQGSLNGYREIGALAVCTVAVSALNLGLMAVLSLGFGSTGAALAVGILPVGMLVIYGAAMINRRRSPLGAGRATVRALSEPVRFGAAAFAANLLNTGTLLTARRIVINSFGLAGNGWYQAVLTLSDQYLNVLVTSVTTYVLPTLAKLKTASERVAELNRVGRVMFLLLTPAVVMMLLVREPLMRLLYSDAFVPAIPLLEWQLVGVYFKMLAWTLGSPLLVVASPRFIVAQELFWDLSYIAGIVVFPHWLGFAGLGVAFVVAFLLHSVILGLYMKRRLGLRWTGGNRLLLVTSLGLILLTKVLSGGGWIGVALTVLALGGWQAVNVGKSEWRILGALLAGIRTRLSG